jgi:hypothetical protein
VRPNPLAEGIDPAEAERRWEIDRQFREREIAVKEREQEAKAAEVKLKQEELTAGKWTNPLVVAILAAAVAGIGNVGISWLNAHSERALEAEKAEQARILEVIKTGSPDKAAQNLKFLVDSGLISDSRLRTQLQTFLDHRSPGSGPSLPSAASAPHLEKPIIDNARVYLLAGVQTKTSQFPALRDELNQVGFAVLGAKFLVDKERQDGPEVRYFDLADKTQAEHLGEFMSFRLGAKAIQVKQYTDARVKPGYIEIWLGR